MVDAVEQLVVLKHLLIAGGKSVIKIFDTRTLAVVTSIDGKAPLTLWQDKLFSSCYEVPDMIKVCAPPLTSQPTRGVISDAAFRRCGTRGRGRAWGRCTGTRALSRASCRARTR